MDTKIVDEEILKYETIINEKLKNDLAIINERQKQIFLQLNNYADIKAFITLVQNKEFGKEPLRTQIDLGCNFYMRCTIPSTEKIVIFAGLETYIEFDIEEAIPFIDKRIKLLNDCLETLEKQASFIKATIKIMLDTLSDLQGITEKTKE